MSKHYHDTPVHNRCGLCCTKVNHLSLTLGREKILDDINLHLHCGELTAVIGPNGAGKSTLLKALIGQYRCSGDISFFSAAQDSYRTPILGYVPQNPAFEKDCPMSVYDLFAASGNYPVWFPARRKTRLAALDALSKTGSEYLINKPLGVLSGGEAQRVMLALALTPLPSILLLDEPFSGLDQVNIYDFYHLIDRLRTRYDLAILMVSHDFDYIKQYADKVILLNRSVIASGTPEEVFACEAFTNIYPTKQKGGTV